MPYTFCPRFQPPTAALIERPTLRFQSEAKAQLVLQVTEDAAAASSAAASTAPCLPSVVALEDDIELMERVKLEDNRCCIDFATM
jgi:hypothetical protein